MSKAITIVALTCFLIVGAAAAAILSHDSVPAAGAAMVASPAAPEFVSNKESKSDRLAISTAIVELPELSQTGMIPSEPLRQAFAAIEPTEIEGLKVTNPVAPPAPPKPKAAAKPPVQKSYALLSDAQIAGIKDRLKLSASQESYWPAVENALRAVARKIHASRQADPAGAGVPIDPEAEEVQQLKSAAMPLLFQLREDQKREVRSLARLIGLEKVAAAI